MTAAANMMKLWFWPWDAALAASRLAETVAATQSVLSVRLPMMAAAASNPLQADHRELSLMVSEKVDAFGRSGRSVSLAGRTVQRGWDANARDFGKLAGGGFLGPFEWLAIFERNLQVAATLMALPMQALGPIHKGVTSNARRLSK